MYYMAYDLKGDYGIVRFELIKVLGASNGIRHTASINQVQNAELHSVRPGKSSDESPYIYNR